MTTIHSVHVKTYDSQGEKQMNSPEFKKHLEAQHGEFHYGSDKGVAFKFKKDYHAAAFHRGIQSHFKHLGSENDGEMNEDTQSDEKNHYSVHKGSQGWYVNQHTANGVWHHSTQTGYHPTKQKAIDWAKNHAGPRPHKIDITEEGEGGPVNVAANVADPKNKPLFGKPAKRKIPSFKSFVRK